MVGGARRRVGIQGSQRRRPPSFRLLSGRWTFRVGGRIWGE